MSSVSAQIPGKSNPGAKVAVVIVRQCPGCQVVYCFESQIGTVSRLGLRSDQIEVLVPTHAQVQRQIPSSLPVVLEINAKHLGPTGEIKVGIADRDCHTAHGSPRGEALRIQGSVSGNDAWKSVKVDFQRWIEFKETAEFWFPKVVESGPECMLAAKDGEVIFELILRLIRLLRTLTLVPK